MILVKFRKVSDLSTRRRAAPLKGETAEPCRETHAMGNIRMVIWDTWGLDHLWERLLYRWAIIKSGHQLEIHIKQSQASNWCTGHRCYNLTWRHRVNRKPGALAWETLGVSGLLEENETWKRLSHRKTIWREGTKADVTEAHGKRVYRMEISLRWRDTSNMKKIWKCRGGEWTYSTKEKVQVTSCPYILSLF